LHHGEKFRVYRVVLTKHGFFTIQCLESLVVEPAIVLVKFKIYELID
jgi:hypothetical protein